MGGQFDRDKLTGIHAAPEGPLERFQLRRLNAADISIYLLDKFTPSSRLRGSSGPVD